MIQPNPESSLNEEAGKLLLEDYASFERTARVMTKVHAMKRDDVIRQYGAPLGGDGGASSSTSVSGSQIHEDEVAANEDTGTGGPQSSGTGNVLKALGSQPNSPPLTDEAAAAAVGAGDVLAAKKKKSVGKKKTGLKRL